MLTLHRTVIRRVIGGTPAGARPFVYPSFDGTAGESAAHSREAERSSVRTAGSSILPRPFVTAQCLTEEASHEVTMPRTPREGTTDIHRNERPVQGDTAGRFTTAAGAAESPCRTDAAYTNTNGGSAAVRRHVRRCRVRHGCRDSERDRGQRLTTPPPPLDGGGRD